MTDWTKEDTEAFGNAASSRGTFAGASRVLRDAGALSVGLCVTRGIFSKGLPIDGIDEIYTTDSYQRPPYRHIDLMVRREESAFGELLLCAKPRGARPLVRVLSNYLRDEARVR